MTLLFWGTLAILTLVAALILTYPIRKQYRYLSMTLFVVLFLVSFALYENLGASKKLQRYWALEHEKKLAKTELSKIKNPEQLVAHLKLYLRSHPNSSKGWYLLGKIYFVRQQYAEALFALQKAHGQQPNNREYALAFAKASFFENGRRLKPNVVSMLKRIIAKDPRRIDAINLLAVAAYLKKDYRLATDYWEKILPFLQVGSRDQKVLLSMIAEAQKKLPLGHRMGSRDNKSWIAASLCSSQ